MAGAEHRDREPQRERSPRAIMLAAIGNYNDIQRRQGTSHTYLTVATTGVEPSLNFIDRMEGINNRLSIAVTPQGQRTSHVPLGNYDPGRRRFVVYPELVPSASERKIIGQLATDEREQATHRRYDFDDDIIADLHTRHRAVLLNQGLIYKIAERYNRIPPGDRHKGLPECRIDENSLFHVALYPKMGGFDGGDIHSLDIDQLHRVDGGEMHLSVYGNLLQRNGWLIRDDNDSSYVKSFKIADLDLDSTQPRYKPDTRLLSLDEFGPLYDLAKELTALKVNYHRFDTERLAMRLFHAPF